MSVHLIERGSFLLDFFSSNINVPHMPPSEGRTVPRPKHNKTVPVVRKNRSASNRDFTELEEKQCSYLELNSATQDTPKASFTQDPRTKTSETDSSIRRHAQQQICCITLQHKFSSATELVFTTSFDDFRSSATPTVV